MMSEPNQSDDSNNRRHFLKRTAGAAVGSGFGLSWLASMISRSASNGLLGARGDWGIVRPPGAPDEDEFLSLCVRCTRCADACDTQCIRFFGAEAGSLEGTPYIIPHVKACNMCLACTQACPATALGRLERREDVSMGVAVVDERLCVSHNGRGVCGACHTICPLRNRAITVDFRNQPTVHPEACTGCGLCEEVCIVRERRAIIVTTTRHPADAGEEA